MQKRFAALTIALIGLIVLISIGGGALVVHQYRALTAEDGATKESQRLRNGVVAILDIVRVRDSISVVLDEGRLDGPGGETLIEAADYLYVRSDTLKKTLGEAPPSEGRTVTVALDDLVQEVDLVLANDMSHLLDAQPKIKEKTQRAIGAIVSYYDAQNRHHVRAVVRQETLLRRLVLTTVGLISVFVLIATGATILWRLEKMARMRRNEAESRARQLAYFDPLTQLPNRTSFMTEAARILGENDGPALFLIDLDDFKLINDTHGHHMGDALLSDTAERCQAFFSKRSGFAARLGGDEFAAVLPDGGDSENLAAHCQNLLAVLSEPISHDGVVFEPKASIGVAKMDMLSPDQAPTLSALMRAADYALYKAKADGRFTSQIYDSVLAASVARRRELKLAMPKALDDGEFFVEFQPKVFLHDNTLQGFEALVRWRRDGVVVPPSAFIEIAEEDDFIIKLDDWVLRAALREAAVLNCLTEQAPDQPPVTISVNLSARNFRRSNTCESIARAVETSGVPPELLTLEITESVLIEDWETTLETLRRLSSLGLKIALDDFGTGFSSLSYLRRLNVDEVKIDRAFVVDIETSDRTRMMMDALVDIASSLEMQLTIEGIETHGQAKILGDLGGDVGQGFLFSRPISAAAARKLVERSAGRKPLLARTG